jgi:hypothetical protein
MSKRKHLEATRRFKRLAIVSVTLAAMLLPTTNAYAWKPITHVYLAQVAYDDAVNDGKVTIYQTDYLTGVIKTDSGGQLLKVGDYLVNPTLLDAIKRSPSQFRAGVLGPDAYPDILTGQQIIHPAGAISPGETGKDLNPGGPGPNPWLDALWHAAYDPIPGQIPPGSLNALPLFFRQIFLDRWQQIINARNEAYVPERAFVAGYLTHAAGDMFGHTFINYYTGDAFHFVPTPQNAIKHVVLEGYIAEKTPDPKFDASISGVEDFIYTNMVYGPPGTVLGDRLLRGENTKFSIPAVFSTLRVSLQRDIDAYYAQKSAYDKQIDDANIFNKIKYETQKLAFMAANGPRVTYEEYWRGDIDSGLRAWPSVSHDVALALFFNPEKKADVDRVKAILDSYVNKHLLSMAGAPDFVGATRAIVGSWIDAILNIIGIPAIKQAIENMKTDLYDYVLFNTLGMTTGQVKEYLGSSATQFDPVLNNPAFFTEGGNRVSRADFDRDQLKLSGRPTFDYQQVPAAYNTVVMTKLLMMDPAEVNRLMRDLGSSRTLNSPCAVLGFARTLDGSNQWDVNPVKMVVAQDQAAYQKIFMRQLGE